jgi:ABC-type Mn2+/Zn2+ transport system permease subunit
MGAVSSAVGVYLSYLWDLPTGATIVGTLGAGLVVLAGVRALMRRKATAPVYVASERLAK